MQNFLQNISKILLRKQNFALDATDFIRGKGPRTGWRGLESEDKELSPSSTTASICFLFLFFPFYFIFLLLLFREGPKGEREALSTDH